MQGEARETRLYIGQSAAMQLPPGQGPDHIPASIEELTDETITVMTSVGRSGVSAAPGDEITLWVVGQDTTEALRTRVIQRLEGSGGVLVLQRREFLRMDLTLCPEEAFLILERVDPEATVAGQNGGQQTSGQEAVPLVLTNLGAGGLHFYTTRPLVVGDRIHLAFRLGPEDARIEGMVEVVWVEVQDVPDGPVNVVGARFIDLLDQRRDLIVQFISKEFAQRRVEELWARFRESRDRGLREQLIIQYTPLVKYVIRRVTLGLPSVVDAGDILSHGIIGLIDAVERFDSTRGVKFETYAIQRIRGSMIDALRSLDMMPRNAGKRARAVEDTSARLHQELGHVPSSGEVAAQVGMTKGQYEQALLDAGAGVVSLEGLLGPGEGEDGLSLLETLEDKSAASPDAVADKREVRRLLLQAIRQLPPRDRLVVSLYYNDELTLKDIAKVLEISESRVCQLHTQTVLKLRAHLRAELEPSPAPAEVPESSSRRRRRAIDATAAG